MLVDAQKLVDGQLVEADLCIVGSGLAGLALASTFLDSDVRVVVLESGREGPSEADQLSEGASTAHPSHPLPEGAPRRLGGAAETWGAWCRPFDALDFEARDWPWSGWPLTAEDMAPYYEQAIDFLRMSAREFTGIEWEDGLPPLYRHIQDATELLVGVWQESPLAPISEVLGDPLREAPNTTVYLSANALEIVTDDDVVTGVAVATPNGKRFTVVAGQYVLAAGGLGTPRLMLASNARCRAGVGNERDTVGRFFAEHPHIVAGRLSIPHPKATGRPTLPAIDRGVRGTFARLEMERPRAGIRAGICLDEDLRRREGLLNVIAHVRPPSVEPPLIALLFFREVRHRNVKKALNLLPELLRHIPEVVNVVYRRLLRRPHELELYVQAETAPNPESRVVLSDEKDDYGIPRAELQWRIGSLDKELLARSVSYMARQLEVAGFGRFEPEPWLTDPGEVWGTEPFGGLHLMGTTRMSINPDEGVVDPDGRVHGYANLWIVGSSVFPTYGAANPGMTIVATTFRTAERLAAELGRR